MASKPPASNADVKADSNMTDDEFLAAFENCTLPFDVWNHRAHVRVAFLYASDHPWPAATDKMRCGIQSYNAANDVPEALDRGYHETMTQSYMQLVFAAVAQTGPHQSADEFFDQHPELLDKRVLREFYSRGRIMTWMAKREFVQPDVRPLPVVSQPRSGILVANSAAREPTSLAASSVKHSATASDVNEPSVAAEPEPAKPEATEPAASAVGSRIEARDATGIVIVDHGSRRPQSNDMLCDLVSLFAAQSDFPIIEPAHMELAEPSITTAVGRCVARGARKVVVHPYFLFPGRHGNEDIPRLAADAARVHDVDCLVTEPLGLHPLMLRVITDRIEQTLREQPP